jgi:hypothetical protein
MHLSTSEFTSAVVFRTSCRFVGFDPVVQKAEEKHGELAKIGECNPTGDDQRKSGAALCENIRVIYP